MKQLTKEQLAAEAYYQREMKKTLVKSRIRKMGFRLCTDGSGVCLHPEDLEKILNASK